MITLDDRELKRLERKLETVAKRAVPFATRNTVNTAAFTAQRLARENIQRDMVNRNRWTAQSVRVEQTRTLNVRNQAAVVGSMLPYMETQEFGGVKQKTGKEGVSISTSYSSGEGENARPRRKLPRKPNKLQNIRLKKRVRGARSNKQKNLITTHTAIQTGRRYVFMQLKRRKGIFRVLGGKRRPRIRMVWDMTEQSVRIPPTPWLNPAVNATRPQIPGVYKKSLEFQLRRLGLFR